MNTHTQVIQSHKVKYLIFAIIVFLVLGVVENSSGQLQAQSQNMPGKDLIPSMTFFSSMPVHLIGETVETDGYTITLNQVFTQDDNLALDITLVNNSAHEIDLNWAVKLYSPYNELVAPENPLPLAKSILPVGSSLQRTWYYKINVSIVEPGSLSNWRLLYAPFGWSGPVVLYRLSETAPAEHVTSNREITPNVYGITGDPWKILVLIYPNIDTDYIEGGVSKHLTASMPAQDIENMKNDFLNLPHQKNVFTYSGGTAELESHIVVVDRPLTNLEPIGEGFWPSPDVTRQELNLHGPKDKYDSVIVFWQASNPSTGQSLPVYGWGLGYWPYDYANGMTYATVFNLSWVWPTDACKGEVFLHEWLHGVTGFYLWRGYSFPFEDLHGAEEAGYVTDANGCWKTWLTDYMRGLVYEGGIRKALVPETWYGGSITTYSISGWRGEYYNNQTLSGVPILVRDDPEINFEWQLGSPHPLILNDGFSGRWTKNINFEQGVYKFDLFRDDGIRLKIDGVTVLEQWQSGREWISLTRTMTAGQHIVQVEFYEVDGYSSVVFQYAKLLPGEFNKSDPLNSTNVQTLTPKLDWGDSVGAESYEYCLDQGVVDNICNEGWFSTGMDTFVVLPAHLTDGYTYHWQVRARNANGIMEANGGWWGFGVQLTKPSIPTNLTVANTTTTTVTIGWSDTEYEAGYNIYKWGPNASGIWGFYYYTMLGHNITSFTDINLTCNSSYWYEVSAYNLHGESAHAGWIRADTRECGYTSFSIFGNAGVASATLSYVDGTLKTVTADGSGNYSISVPIGWSGTVTPNKTGYTFAPVSKSYSNVQSNQTDQNYTASVCVGCAEINVTIGGTLTGQYTLPAQGSTRASFVGVNNGPVQIASTLPSIAAERLIYKVNGVDTSFSEMLALPNSQLDTTYWLPWYNNTGLDTQLRIGNVSGAPASVHVYIGGVEMPGSPFALTANGAGQSTRVSFAGVNNGPVQIVSDVNIVAAERLIYKVNGVDTSFTEMLALPNSQLDTTYWLPWYNNTGLDTQLRIGNVSGTPASVHVYIGGVEMPGSPFALTASGAGQSTRVSFAGVNAGPVQIVSNVNIVAAERLIYKVNGVDTSFSEMLALPNSQLDTTYWLPWYNNTGLDTQLRIGNVSGTPASVHVYIGGVEMPGSPFALTASGAGQSTRVSFAGVNSGPVQIVSNVNIVAAERLIYKVNGVDTSFTEMLALPNSQLDTTYWLPWYNNTGLDTQLRFGVP